MVWAVPPSGLREAGDPVAGSVCEGGRRVDVSAETVVGGSVSAAGLQVIPDLGCRVCFEESDASDVVAVLGRLVTIDGL